MVLLFPALALGETVKFEDLVYREGLYYKKFSDVPFTGKVTGNTQGVFRNGKKHGPWVSYHENGQLESKVTFLYGKRVQPVLYLINEVRHQLSRCWNIVGGIKSTDFHPVQIKIKLTKNGELKQKPEILNTALYQNDIYYKIQSESAIRALQNPKCVPFKLPLTFYDLWKNITLTFGSRHLM